jgi:hypothetical protein
MVATEGLIEETGVLSRIDRGVLCSSVDDRLHRDMAGRRPVVPASLVPRPRSAIRPSVAAVHAAPSSTIVVLPSKSRTAPVINRPFRFTCDRSSAG